METISIVIEMDNGKTMEAELYPEVAPVTVDNFVNLIKENFFDGIIFHRVISGFMIQGGDPTGTGMGGSKKTIPGEFTANGFNNTLKHSRGVLSMARTMDPNSASSQFFIMHKDAPHMDPNSASSQFFIMHKDAPHLDGQYAAFGQLTSGFDTLDEIATTRTNRADKPLQEQRIKTIRIK